MKYDAIVFDFDGTLVQSNEIKKYNPVYNRRQRKKLHAWSTYAYVAKDGFYRIGIGKAEIPNGSFINGYSTKQGAQNDLFKWVDKYQLCQKLCGLLKGGEGIPCFHYNLKQCR